MLRIILNQRGRQQVLSFTQSEVSVGRTPGNDIQIPEPGVSSSHAKLVRHPDGSLVMVDLDSTNGTFINGERVRGEQLLLPGDEVQICTTSLTLAPDSAVSAGGAVPELPTPPSAPAPRLPEPPASLPAVADIESFPAESWPAPLDEDAPSDLGELSGPPSLPSLVRPLHEPPQPRAPAPPPVAARPWTPTPVIRAVSKPLETVEPHRQFSAGPSSHDTLRNLLADPEVSEVTINGSFQVAIRRRDRLTALPPLRDEDEVRACVEGLLRRSWSQSRAEQVLLPNGWALHAVHASLTGSTALVRLNRQAAQPWTLEYLLQTSALSPGTANLLDASLRGRLNLLVSYDVGAAAEPFLEALLHALPEEERPLLVGPALSLSSVGAARGCATITADSSAESAAGIIAAWAPSRAFVDGSRESAVHAAFAAVDAGVPTILALPARSAGVALERLTAYRSRSAATPADASSILVARSFDLILEVESRDGRSGARALAEPQRVADGIVASRLWERGRPPRQGEAPKLFSRLRDRGVAVDMSMLEG